MFLLLACAEPTVVIEAESSAAVIGTDVPLRAFIDARGPVEARWSMQFGTMQRTVVTLCTEELDAPGESSCSATVSAEFNEVRVVVEERDGQTGRDLLTLYGLEPAPLDCSVLEPEESQHVESPVRLRAAPREGAAVSWRVDGVDQADTWTAEIEVAPGEHRVTLRMELGEDSCRQGGLRVFVDCQPEIEWTEDLSQQTFEGDEPIPLRAQILPSCTTLSWKDFTITWSSDIDGELGKFVPDHTFIVAYDAIHLSPGTHELTARVENPFGVAATVSTFVYVVDPYS